MDFRVENLLDALDRIDVTPWKNMSCGEADDLDGALRDLGDKGRRVADGILLCHALSDDDGDDHWAWRGLLAAPVLVGMDGYPGTEFECVRVEGRDSVGLVPAMTLPQVVTAFREMSAIDGGENLPPVANDDGSVTLRSSIADETTLSPSPDGLYRVGGYQWVEVGESE